MEQPWTPRPKPEQAEWLERRLEFSDYAGTRSFLERLNALCESEQRFPDISFGRTYVNLTLRPEAEGEGVGTLEHDFAAAIDALAASAPRP
ncbi:4a-hydroxytetrahydrobiopterin dehydratase [Cyanobium sp. ATX 6A2]|jgi:4a-hydroxytetrahydrobiopterin dehydratase|uniref:4a-hydroxytetrahydrobiopterin dehydratase n=1 Tax=Cyanobium sp. ATX 6A2 TaxID=2823700 RepID=UPI0020CD7AB5|nr:4a-hydroxytetrahydrobiopterin dehydratase [Cyanobium sp. ATX 6A2]MCP9887790.1 4a-hydroxytetrahydrobiopterin dehydratase [Cyanobium sp. ATX 6A2]